MNKMTRQEKAARQARAWRVNGAVGRFRSLLATARSTLGELAYMRLATQEDCEPVLDALQRLHERIKANRVPLITSEGEVRLVYKADAGLPKKEGEQ